MTLEGQVLLALWRLYKLDKISMQQKGCIKDQLIRRDLNFYSAIGDCQNLDQLEEKLLDILNWFPQRSRCRRNYLSNYSFKQLIQYSNNYQIILKSTLKEIQVYELKQ